MAWCALKSCQCQALGRRLNCCPNAGKAEIVLNLTRPSAWEVVVRKSLTCEHRHIGDLSHSAPDKSSVCLRTDQNSSGRLSKVTQSGEY